MTRKEFYETIADRTGDDLTTIELIGFELNVPTYEVDHKELKRQRRLRRLRQARRERRLADLAGKYVQS